MLCYVNQKNKQFDLKTTTTTIVVVNAVVFPLYHMATMLACPNLKHVLTTN